MTESLGRTGAWLLLAWVGLVACDRDRPRQPEPETIDAPASRTSSGNVNQAMGADQPIIPTLPTPQQRFLIAVKQGERDEAERWLRQGASVEEGAVLVAGIRGEGALGFVEWLLSRGAPVDASDESGRTALSWAAGQGSIGEVELLLARGAAVHSADTLGRTPLHFAVFGGDGEVVERLLKASADVDAQDSLGSTPLMYACSKNQPEIIATLRSHGANPRLEDKLGRTAAARAHGENNPCIAFSPEESPAQGRD